MNAYLKITFIIFFICLLVVIINISDFQYSNEPHSYSDFKSCKWSPNDPILYYLRTKSGVNYEGGHWFHIAENFMVQYSKLKAINQLANSSTVYFNFDKAHFVFELNGMTRLLITSGMTSAKHISSAHFMFSPKLKDNCKKIKKGQTLLLSQNFDFKEHEIIAIPAVTENNGFKTANNLPSSDAHHLRNNKDQDVTVCVKLGGMVGGEWPTPQRGHWFPHIDDIPSFRNNLRELCPVHGTVTKNAYKFRNGVRTKRSKCFNPNCRKLIHIEDVVHKLKLELGSDWDIEVLIHDPNVSPCVLAKILSVTDICVTAHGFQSMLLLFLPRPAIIFEIFPYRYLKRGYGPFSKEYGKKENELRVVERVEEVVEVTMFLNVMKQLFQLL